MVVKSGRAGSVVPCGARAWEALEQRVRLDYLGLATVKLSWMQIWGASSLLGQSVFNMKSAGMREKSKAKDFKGKFLFRVYI